MRLDQKALEVFQAFRSLVRRARLDRYGPVRRALLALLVLRAPLAILVRQACLESTVKTAVTATTVRRVLQAILVQMGAMAQTATKVLQALKDLGATEVTEAMQV